MLKRSNTPYKEFTSAPDPRRRASNKPSPSERVGQLERPSTHNIGAVPDIEDHYVRTPFGCRGTSAEVAAMLRLCREVQGLTQQQLGVRMKSTQSTVARWESGDHEITMGTLTRIADALGVVFTVSFGASEDVK